MQKIKLFHHLVLEKTYAAKKCLQNCNLLISNLTKCDLHCQGFLESTSADNFAYTLDTLSSKHGMIKYLNRIFFICLQQKLSQLVCTDHFRQFILQILSASSSWSSVPSSNPCLPSQITGALANLGLYEQGWRPSLKNASSDEETNRELLKPPSVKTPFLIKLGATGFINFPSSTPPQLFIKVIFKRSSHRKM